MAALDPVAFVRSTPPFDSLPPELFEGAARSLEVIYHPTGTKLVTVGEEPLKHLYVIRKGVVRLERAGQTLQLLEEGCAARSCILRVKVNYKVTTFVIR